MIPSCLWTYRAYTFITSYVCSSHFLYVRAIQEYPADPLLHSCIVCASVSCPDVALRVFKPETLKDDMEASMKNFLANTKKGLSLDKDAGSITISKVHHSIVK